MSLKKVSTSRDRGRLDQLKPGNPLNQMVRASDLNPVVEFLNARMGENGATTDAGNTPTINAPTGTFTTATLTTAAFALTTLTLTNSSIAATSNVFAVIEAYSGTIGTAGVPMIAKVLPAAGSATIVITNAHATLALNGTLTITFVVL